MPQTKTPTHTTPSSDANPLDPKAEGIRGAATDAIESLPHATSTELGIAPRVKSMHLPLGDILPAVAVARPLNEAHVEKMLAEIIDHGLLHPITVDECQRLVAGAHRLEALKRFEQASPQVFAVMFPKGLPVRMTALDSATDKVAALRVARSENTRRELTKEETARLLAELREEIPTDKAGRPAAGYESALAVAAEITGKSKRQVLRDAAQAEGRPAKPAKKKAAHLAQANPALSEVAAKEAVAKEAVRNAPVEVSPSCEGAPLTDDRGPGSGFEHQIAALLTAAEALTEMRASVELPLSDTALARLWHYLGRLIPFCRDAQAGIARNSVSSQVEP